jgi:hypothetical protein
MTEHSASSEPLVPIVERVLSWQFGGADGGVFRRVFGTYPSSDGEQIDVTEVEESCPDALVWVDIYLAGGCNVATPRQRLSIAPLDGPALQLLTCIGPEVVRGVADALALIQRNHRSLVYPAHTTPVLRVPFLRLTNGIQTIDPGGFAEAATDATHVLRRDIWLIAVSSEVLVTIYRDVTVSVLPAAQDADLPSDDDWYVVHPLTAPCTHGRIYSPYGPGPSAVGGGNDAVTDGLGEATASAPAVLALVAEGLAEDLAEQLELGLVWAAENTERQVFRVLGVAETMDASIVQSVVRRFTELESAVVEARRATADVCRSLPPTVAGRDDGLSIGTAKIGAAWRAALARADRVGDRLRSLRDSVSAGLAASLLAASGATAERQREFESDIAVFGSLVLVPTLLAGLLGANVAQPFQDEVLGLVLLALICGAGALGSYAWVRRKYPDHTRAPQLAGRAIRPEIWALILGILSAGLFLAAVFTGHFGPPEGPTDPGTARSVRAP